MGGRGQTWTKTKTRKKEEGDGGGAPGRGRREERYQRPAETAGNVSWTMPGVWVARSLLNI